MTGLRFFARGTSLPIPWIKIQLTKTSIRWKRKWWEAVVFLIIWVFPKIGGNPPKMDGEDNGKPLLNMGWFGGTIILETPNLMVIKLLILSGKWFRWNNISIISEALFRNSEDFCCCHTFKAYLSDKKMRWSTKPPKIMVQWKMGVSPIGSLPFKYRHFPLPNHPKSKGSSFDSEGFNAVKQKQV